MLRSLLDGLVKIGNEIKFAKKEGSPLRSALNLLLRSYFYGCSIWFILKRNEEFMVEINLFNFTCPLFLLKIPATLIKSVDV